MRLKPLLRLMEAGIHLASAQMSEVKINHPSAAPGAARLQTQIRAIEMKTGKPGRDTDQRIPPDNDEILIQADHPRGKITAPLIFPMRIGNAENKATIRYRTGIAGKRPIRIKRIQRREADVQRFGIIAEQPNILMAEDHIGAARQAQETPNALEGIPLVTLGIVQIKEFRLVGREAARLKAFHHGCVFRGARDQSANAEERPRKGLAGIHRLLRWNHPAKISPATELRKINLGQTAP
jgi:hypothetical protein